MKRIRVKYKLSIAYYPQLDRQTKRMNQILEEYLWHYINYQQNNWVELLPLIMLVYNSAVSAVTSYTLFFLMFGVNPNTVPQPKAISALV